VQVCADESVVAQHNSVWARSLRANVGSAKVLREQFRHHQRYRLALRLIKLGRT
jgi:hypothetical protein